MLGRSIHIDVHKCSQRNEADDGGTTNKYHLTPQLAITHHALIAKRTTHLDPLVPLSTQLRLLNLFGGDKTPYESLQPW